MAPHALKFYLLGVLSNRRVIMMTIFHIVYIRLYNYCTLLSSPFCVLYFLDIL